MKPTLLQYDPKNRNQEKPSPNLDPPDNFSASSSSAVAAAAAAAAAAATKTTDSAIRMLPEAQQANQHTPAAARTSTNRPSASHRGKRRFQWLH